MIIEVDVKVAGDDEFIRCGGSKRKNYIHQEKQKKVWRRWKAKEDDRY